MIFLLLEGFRGIKRRFDDIGEINGVRIIHDYAHHPTEIKAIIETAKKLTNNNIYVVFQPHTYSRTKLLYDEFLKYFGQIGGYNPDAVEKVSTGERKISDWIDDDDIATNVKQSKPKKDVEVISSIEKPKVNETQNVEFDVNSIEKEKLNYEYIQQLIDKINKLEADDSEISRNELLMLNTELDVILEKLRQ